MSDEELERLLTEADDIKVYKRLVFLKLLYGGATLAEAAEDVGVSEGTASNWAERWNQGGLGKLTPNFGGGRPPKLDQAQQEQLIERLREGQPWKKQEIQHLLDEEFDVEYHPNYLPTFLDDLGLHYAIPRTITDELLGQTDGPELWTDQGRTRGGEKIKGPDISAHLFRRSHQNF